MVKNLAVLLSVFLSPTLFAEGQLPWVGGKPVTAEQFAEPAAKAAADAEASRGTQPAAKAAAPAIGLPASMMMPSLAPEVKKAPVVEVPAAEAPKAAVRSAVSAEPPALTEPELARDISSEPVVAPAISVPEVAPPPPPEPHAAPVSEVAATPTPTPTPTGDEVCHYVVKKGDNLSRILLKLGILPIYGSQGNLGKVVEKNSDKVKRGGDLIFPQVRIAIPAKYVKSNEMCVDGAEEKDVNRRIALYSEAEAEIHRGKYSRLCERVLTLAFTEKQPDNRGRLMHLAAVCQYEEENLPAAHRLWEQVLALNPDPSLRYRATYNMALVECQTDHALSGYEKLRGVSPELWQTQAPYERRTFLDLASYCAERGVHYGARLDTLLTVYQTSPEPELRAYAEEKLRADFADKRHCALTEKILAKLSSDPKHSTWEDLWEHVCD